ncbi:Ger(x)C family spore germination protein [Metabacillus sp. FJAT-52054]|uniref:Ger(X)C family spore germination protein n=1 Tax=Metabacillus sediminis TaxID=3117746 RepID=A0ABZ2NGR7_9BACI
MKKIMLAVLAGLQIFISGCWDQRLLKDSRLVFGTGIDLVEDEQLYVTATIRDFIGGIPNNSIVHTKAHTLRESRMIMDRKVSGQFDPSKNRIFLLGENLAKSDIYSYLDVLYRDSNSSVSSKVAVAKGDASEILDMGMVGNVLISEYLIEIIESQEKSTVSPIHSLQTICTLMFDEGKDFGLPLVKKELNEVTVDGIALFHDKVLSGYLSVDESTLLLLLMGAKAKSARYVNRIHDGEKPEKNNYITYSFLKVKSGMNVIHATPGNIKAEVKMKAEIDVAEYPQDSLTNEKLVKAINKKISEQLTAEAKSVISKIQEANSDMFGIGRELMAYYPHVWKNLDWEKEYPSIEILPKVEVTVTEHGVIN